jgi:hypothetical protein
MSPERNLILVHTPGYQDIDDFQAIAAIVHELAPDIEVFIANNNIPASLTRRRAGQRPTLIFSPGNLLTFRPLRGKVYAGSPVPKIEQIKRFQAAGLPVPPTAEITRNLELPEEKFGSLVVVKPGFSESSRGHFITLMRRESVRFQPRESFPADHPGRYGPMLVQRFIDTGPFVCQNAVVQTPLAFSKITRQHTRFPLSTAPPLAAGIWLSVKTSPRPRSFASGRGSKSHCAMSNAQAVLFRGPPRGQRSRSNVFRIRAAPGKQPSPRRYLQPTRSAWLPSKNALTSASSISTVT